MDTKHHCTGWQGLTAPNGLIVQLYGPCIGDFNDSKMMGLSRLIDMLEGDFLLGTAIVVTEFGGH